MYRHLLGKKTKTQSATDCNSCLVLRDGSSGRYPRYSSASLSRANSWDCSLLRNAGSVSRMWLVSCYGNTTKQPTKIKQIIITCDITKQIILWAFWLYGEVSQFRLQCTAHHFTVIKQEATQIQQNT